MPKGVYSWHDIGELVKNPHKIGWLVGMNDLLPIHSEWVHYIHDSKGVDVGLMASRGSFKTSSLSEIGILYRWMRDPEETIAVVRKSYTNAADVVKAIMGMAESPAIYELLRCCWFMDQNGNVPNNATWKFTTRKDGKLDLSVRKKHTPESSIEAYGINSNFTGKHVKFCLMDDVFTQEDRLYTAEREFSKVIVAELRSNIVNRDGYSAIIGTPYHKLDGWSVLEQAGLPIKKYPYTMLPFISEESIAEARASQPESLFRCNYALDFMSETDHIFQDPRKAEWDRRNVTDIKAHIDAAYSADGDFCALSIVGRLPNDKLCVVGWIEKVHIKDWIPYIYEKLAQYNCHTLYAETNGDHALFLDTFNAHPLAKTYSIWTTGYVEKQNKVIKISTVLYEAWTKLAFAPETDPAYLEQILDFTENSKDHDDSADSLSSLLREGNYVSGGGWMDLYR